MDQSIFNFQQENSEPIKEVLNKFKGTKDWSELRDAFGKIINKFLHGEGANPMDSKELEGHFERALTITKEDVEKYQKWTDSLLANKKDIGSPYYIVNTAHHRKDKHYAPNQEIPILGTGNQTLNARFEAHNIYQKYFINVSSEMPERAASQYNPFPTWDSITEVMQDNVKFEKMFGMTDPTQQKELFDLVSSWSVYLLGADKNTAKNIFIIVSANGNGDPTEPFIGIVNDPSKPKEKIYHALSRYSFTYLSSTKNPMNYWIDMNGDEQDGFTLGIETFFPDHTKSPYIEVLTEFCAQVPKEDIAFYQEIPFLKTFLMLVKGTLMRDLIQAYYPNSSSIELWIRVGALKKGHPIVNALAAKGIDTIAGLFDLFVWKQKPTLWHNWHNTIGVGGPIQKEFEPNNGPNQKEKNIQDEEFKLGLNTLLGIVESAMKDDGVARIRAFGSKWSLNNVAYTNDFMVKTKGLNYAKIGLAQDMLTQKYQDKAEKLCFVQAGVMIHYLNEELAKKGLALKTTGASDGQRLVGAISTGTHGSAMHVGAMQEYVKGIHLVIPDGDTKSTHIFLQRKSDQTVNSNFAAFIGNTQLILDDELFNAAVVSFGCFGLIHGLLIETEKLFKLKHQTVRFNPNLPFYKDKLRTVMKEPTRANLHALAKNGVSKNLFNWLNKEEGYPYFFSVTLNPYHGLFPRTFFLEVMEKVASDDKLLQSVSTDPFLRKREKHEAIHGGFEETSSETLTLSKALLSDGIQIGLKQFHHNSRRPAIAASEDPSLNFPNVVFSTKSATNPVTTSPCPATSTEIGVPISYVNEAVDCILEILQTTHLAAALGIRYLPQSLATLAVNQYDDFTVTIELPGPQKGNGLLCSLFPDAELAHNAIFAALNNRNIPHRFHWGQQYPLNTSWVTKSYGVEKVAAWQNARKKILTTTKAQNLFANELTNDIGLT